MLSEGLTNSTFKWGTRSRTRPANAWPLHPPSTRGRHKHAAYGNAATRSTRAPTLSGVSTGAIAPTALPQSVVNAVCPPCLLITLFVDSISPDSSIGFPAALTYSSGSLIGVAKHKWRTEADAAANGSKPLRSETNRASSVVASRHCPTHRRLSILRPPHHDR